MDINDLRSLGTVLAFVSFISICWWAYGSSRKARFEEAAQLPFADDLPHSPASTTPSACPACTSTGENAQ